MIYLDANATSWPKSKKYLEIRNAIEDDARFLNIRSGMALDNFNEEFCEILQNRFKFPFRVGVIYTGGCTEALNIAINYGLISNHTGTSPVIDPVIHDAAWYPISNKVKQICCMNESKKWKEVFAVLNLSSSIMPILRHHHSKELTVENLPDITKSTIAIDAAQFIDWKSDFRILEKYVYEDNVLLIAFGFHKKLRMYPGQGLLVYDADRINPEHLLRCIVGGNVSGDESHFYTYGRDTWPTGTFNPIPFHVFKEMMKLDSDLLEYHPPTIEYQSANVIENYLEDYYSPGINVSRNDNTWCYWHDEMEISDMSSRLMEHMKKGISISEEFIWRVGKICCSHYFNVIAKSNEKEGILRISIQ